MLLTPEDVNKQLVPFFFYAEAKTLWVFKQFAEYGVSVAQGSIVNRVILDITLHQGVQSFEQVEVEEVVDVGFIPRQVQVERRDQGHDQRLLVQLLLSFLQFLLVVLQQEVYSVENRLRVNHQPSLLVLVIIKIFRLNFMSLSFNWLCLERDPRSSDVLMALFILRQSVEAEDRENVDVLIINHKAYIAQTTSRLK